MPCPAESAGREPPAPLEPPMHRLPSKIKHRRAQRLTKTGLLDPRRDIGNYTNEHQKLCFNTSRWDAYLYGGRKGAVQKAEADLAPLLREDAALEKAPARKVEGMAEAIGRELFSRLYGDPARLDPE